jgi:putative ABC transport system substrate-binding protein
MNAMAEAIAALAAARRLPSVGYALYADAGGLLAYGSNREAVYRRAGSFVDRIVKGAHPGELPIERARKFDTVVNLKVAQALGLKIPQTVLLHADRVIE